MGRWTQYDEDEYRLPEGMTRIGYDSDSGRYLFKDHAGNIWQGAEGAEFSEMTRVSGPSSSDQRDEEDVPPARADGYQALAPDANSSPYQETRSPYRTLFPFFLVIGVILLSVWRFVLNPGFAPPPRPCPDHSVAYMVAPGDSCWAISNAHGKTVEELQGLNPTLVCQNLMPGSTVCLPDGL
ncbi:hypothetical protein C8J56DRAFT_938779 [Mycena floridula]|nr:hypothetical protein C8J56DRAFT_938779 [Mycena floridula]